LGRERKLKNPTDIDKVILVELPNADLYPKLEKVVSRYMIHGSCEPTSYNSPCMKEGRCSIFKQKNSHLQLQLMKKDIHVIEDLIMVDLLRIMELNLTIKVLFLTIHLF